MCVCVGACVSVGAKGVRMVLLTCNHFSSHHAGGLFAVRVSWVDGRVGEWVGVGWVGVGECWVFLLFFFQNTMVFFEM